MGVMTDATSLSSSIKFDSWDDLLQRIARRDEGKPSALVPPRAKIASSERVALTQLVSQFGSVNLDVPRTLTPAEIDSLLAERRTVDIVAKLVTKRKDEIATIVKVHHNEAHKDDPEADSYGRAKDGTYALKDQYPGDDDEDQFSVETRSGSVKVDLDGLLAAADDPDVTDIDHETYLGLTRPVRVLDPDKAADLVRKRPALLRVLARYTERGRSVVSVYARKKK